MKSPNTGKEMKRMVRREHLEFRKESFTNLYHYYLCEDSGEEFTDLELDTINLNQVYNQYREKFNLPFPDEIKYTREQYGLSAAKMAEILGLGINHYRLYENGEVPSISNARLIQAAKDPVEFKKFVLASGVLKDNALTTILTRIEELIKKETDFFYNGLPQYLMGGLDNDRPNVYTGYTTPKLSKAIELIIFFTRHLNLYKTKLNKLLFYCDFSHYKNTGFGITGLGYRAIQLGPVPANFDSIFEYAASKGYIEIVYQEFENGKCGELFQTGSNTLSDAQFNESELQTINNVLNKFRNASTNEIIDISHTEKAWKENIGNKSKISYDYAFELIHA